MSQPRETVIVPLPPGDYIGKIEVYYGDSDKPEREAQVVAGTTECKVKLAAGATEEDCLILVKQLDTTKNPVNVYTYCCGRLMPYNPEEHVLGFCCSDDEPEEPTPEPEFQPEVSGPTLEADRARFVEEEQPFHQEMNIEVELDLGDELSLDDDEDDFDDEDEEDS
jgi:hypothetical protein